MPNNIPQFQKNFRPALSDLERLAGNAVSEFARSEKSAKVREASYFASRSGYNPNFLEPFFVDFPKVQDTSDVLQIPEHQNQLPYEHFSVVMSVSRRMAIYTAVNIHGRRTVSIEREKDRWAYDGRIPTEAQLGEELYDENPLDRGHLVRREDPNWGPEAVAERANEDTFHFTNCSPQMGAFNQKTWLGLENYILGNARVWREKVSVFTGPVFREDDREYREARIPSAYWKIIAFLSDDGAPSATAYIVDQDNELRSLEAAFGRYKTYQRSVADVEKMTGLQFGELSQYDALSGLSELGITAEVELVSPSDILIPKHFKL